MSKKKTTAFGIRISIDLLNLIKRLAKKKNRSTNNMINIMIVNGYADACKIEKSEISK